MTGRIASGIAPVMALVMSVAMAGEPPAKEKPAGAQQSNGMRVPVDFIDSDGRKTGSVILTETDNGVFLDANLRDLKEGWHGFHVHEKGKCETPDFKSAGGHYAPHGSSHGFMVAEGKHAGDMPNFFVGKDGNVRIQHFLENVTLQDGKASLLDEDGSAIMVHSGADDYRSQPSGDAGSRVACASVGGSQS